MTTTPLLRSAPTLAAATAMAVAALLSGCAADQPSQDPVETDTSPTPPGAQPSPTPTAPTVPEAADGTDLDACADADCEVLVEEGDEFTMDGTYGVDRFVVDTVDEDGLSMSGYGPGITLSGHLPPPDEEAPATFVMNGISITLIALDDSRAVMSMSSP